MYILNEIPVRTTNNFKINDVKVDLEIPTNLEFKEFNTKNTNDIEIKYSIINNFLSNIGLDLPKALNIDITISKKIEEPIEFIYEFTDDNLIDNININCIDKADASIIFKYISKSDNKNFHHLKIITNLSKDTKLNITTINLLNENSNSLIASESNLSDNSTLTQNLIDLGGNIKINNYKSIANKNSSSYLNNIYIGKDDDLLDMNYNYINNDINSITNIDTVGSLNDKAIKTFRGTIDFISGSSKSIGKESENCILLSDDVISRSVPLLLCAEEDVIGAHSVSTGKIDEDKLFYLESHGLSKEEAKKLLILSSFNKLVEKINNKELEEKIISYIENKV